MGRQNARCKWIGALLSLFFLLSGCTTKEERFLQAVSKEETRVTEYPQTVPSPTEVPQERTIYVDVRGAVVAPGVYELPQESRVFIAVEAAGGLRADARGEAINQAALLHDGQQIYVPTREELPEAALVEQLTSGGTNQLVDLNTASVTELTSLPGIGEAKAKAILQYREEYGPFASVEELTQVEGIKEGTFDRIKDQITVR